jgi:hypothetical protein
MWHSTQRDMLRWLSWCSMMREPSAFLAGMACTVNDIASIAAVSIAMYHDLLAAPAGCTRAQLPGGCCAVVLC